MYDSDRNVPNDIPGNAAPSGRPLYDSIRARTERHRADFQELLGTTPFHDSIETLLSLWVNIVSAYRKVPDLSPIVPLIIRGQQDIEVSAFALDSGIYSIVTDRARDLMEIEFLLRHFTHHNGSLGKWLKAGEKERKDRYSANALRQAEAKRRGIEVGKLPDHRDYRGHSISLHVGLTNPIPRGIVTSLDEGLLATTMTLFELIGHGITAARQANSLLSVSSDIVEIDNASSDFQALYAMADGCRAALASLGFPVAKIDTVT